MSGATCPICLDEIKSPVSIPCGHIHCEQCLIEYVEQNDDDTEAACPTCRTKFCIVTPDLRFVPSKYHKYILPTVRRIYLPTPNNQGAHHKEHAERLQRENARLMERLTAVQSRCAQLESHETRYEAEVHAMSERCDQQTSIARHLKQQLRHTELANRDMTQQLDDMKARYEDLKDKYRALKHTKGPLATSLSKSSSKRTSAQAALDNGEDSSQRPILPIPKRPRMAWTWASELDSKAKIRQRSVQVKIEETDEEEDDWQVRVIPPVKLEPKVEEEDFSLDDTEPVDDEHRSDHLSEEEEERKPFWSASVFSPPRSRASTACPVKREPDDDINPFSTGPSHGRSVAYAPTASSSRAQRRADSEARPFLIKQEELDESDGELDDEFGGPSLRSRLLSRSIPHARFSASMTTRSQGDESSNQSQQTRQRATNGEQKQKQVQKLGRSGLSQYFTSMGVGVKMEVDDESPSSLSSTTINSSPTRRAPTPGPSRLVTSSSNTRATGPGIFGVTPGPTISPASGSAPSSTGSARPSRSGLASGDLFSPRRGEASGRGCIEYNSSPSTGEGWREGSNAFDDEQEASEEARRVRERSYVFRGHKLRLGQPGFSSPAK